MSRLLVVLVFLVALFSPGPVAAYEGGFWSWAEPAATRDSTLAPVGLSISMSAWWATLIAEAQVDIEELTGTKFDLPDTLDFRRAQILPMPELSFQIMGMLLFRLQGALLELKSDEVLLDKTIRFEGITFNAGELVDAKAYVGHGRLGFELLWFNNSLFAVGTGLGIEVAGTYVKIEEVWGLKAEDQRAIVTFPTLELSGRVSPPPLGQWLGAYAQLNWFEIQPAAAVDLQLGLIVSPIEHLNFLLGYRRLFFKVKDIAGIKAELGLSGLFLGAAFVY